MPSAWGHTRLLETDWRFITQESHCFSCGSVKASLPEKLYEMDLFKVVVELKNYGVTMISDEVYQYSKDGTEMNGVMGAGFRISFEE